MAAFDAIILAGGLARRLGGVDKPGLRVGGVPLVDRVAAAAAGARRLIVVGPPRELPGAIFTREDPPGGGPVPALRAGLTEAGAPWVALLAGDLPFLAREHLDALFEAAQSGTEPAGAVLIDGTGREQWLTGVWPAARLRAALAAYDGRSLHGLLSPLDPVRLALPGTPWFDCDTMDDLRTGAEMNVLTEWTALACKELGIDPARVDRDVILDLTKEVAHGVARPAAPLTAYLLGLAQGAGTAPDDAVARLTTLAHNWEQATTETLTDG